MGSLAGTRVLIVITKSGWGGAQSYVYSLATRLKKDGIEVTVAFGGTGERGSSAGRLAALLTSAEINTLFLTSFARDIGGFSELRALAELRRAIRKIQPHVLHMNSSKAGALGALAGRLERVSRIVFTAHGWAHREPRPFLARTCIRLLSWLTVLLSHRVIAVSHLDYEDAPVILSRKKLREIKNGIGSFTLASREEARALIREKTGAPDGPWLLMTSELHPNKGIDIALAAFANITEAYPHASLIIIGDGDARSALRAQAHQLGLSGRAYFSGFLPDARTLLRAADIFILPSRKEGLPMALLEAGMASLPTIASATGGIPEVIENGVHGILVAPEDIDALTGAYRLLLDDPEHSSLLGSRLHDRVVHDFSEDLMLTKTFDVYTD